MSTVRVMTRSAPARVPALPQMNHVAGDEARLLADEVRDDGGNLVRLGDMEVFAALRNESAYLGGDPAGVSDRRVHDVRGDAVIGELARRGHRVVLLRRLGRAV